MLRQISTSLVAMMVMNNLYTIGLMMRMQSYLHRIHDDETTSIFTGLVMTTSIWTWAKERSLPDAVLSPSYT